MKTLIGKVGIFCMAAVMLASLLLAALLPVRPALAEGGAGDAATAPVTVDTHLNTEGEPVTVFDTAATEGAKKVSISEMDTGTLTTIFGRSDPSVDGLINGKANDIDGTQREMGVLEKDTDGSIRMYMHWRAFTHSRQKIVFDTPVSVDEFKGGMMIGVYLHMGVANPFQTNGAAYGIMLYSADDTGASGEGVLVSNTTTQDAWTDILISDSQLKLLADKDGMISGLQIGSRFHCEDPNAYNIPSNITEGDNISKNGWGQAYIKIKDVKKAPDGATLEKVYGQTTVDNEPTRDMSRAIEVVSDDTAQDNDSYFFRMNWYGVVTSSTTIVFDEPLKVNEISELVVRLKVDADVDQDPYFTNDTNGISLYPLGAVGETGEGVQLQSKNITQREWVDYSISYNQAKKLADEDGYIRGVQLGARFHWGETLDANEAGDYSHGYSHDQTGGTDDNLTINIDTFSYVPYEFDGYLTQGDGGVSEQGTGTITEVNGVSGADFDGLHHALNEGDIKPVADADAVDGWALKINLFAWSAVRSRNYAEFRTPVKADEVDGLVVRLKLHISQSQPYASASYGYGVYLFDKGATGAAEEQFTIPQDTLQEKYVNVYIGKNDVIRMAGADGMLEGLQISSYLNIGVDTTTYNNGEPYIMIDYIAVSQNKQITFKDGDEVLKTDTAPTFFETTENYYIPQKEGKLFLGWKNGDEFFDFSALLQDDVTLTAAWVDQMADVSSYYGLYKATDGEYISLTADGIEVSSVTDAYAYWGMGTDEKLYIVNGTEQFVLDLSGEGEYTKVDSVTVTYNTKIASEPTLRVLVEKNTAATAPNVVRNGYELTGWVDADGNPFNFETVLTGDITLTAVYEPVEISDASKYYGNYYDKATGTMVVLAAENKATFTAGGTDTERVYYILKDNVIAFAEGDDYTEGTMLAARFMFDGTEYIRLTQYLVTFDTDGGSEVEQQTVNAASGYLATKPADPTKEGYTFAGWFLSDNTQFDFNTVLTESVTLYAHWTFADNAGGNTEGESGGGCSGLFAGTSAIAAATLIGAAVVVLAKRKHRS